VERGARAADPGLDHEAAHPVHARGAEVDQAVGAQAAEGPDRSARPDQFYQVLETEIRGANGSEFSFSGLSEQTVDSIKSFEGCDIVWVEEAQTVSKRSWSVLIPTIRKPGSEIWITFNPELDTDETYDRFITNQPEGRDHRRHELHGQSVVPRRAGEGAAARQGDAARAEYLNIWEGKCKPAVAGAIYYDEVTKAEEKRICNVPYDPMLKVHVVFDLGWNDAMSISLVQKQSSELRVIENIEDSHKTLDHYSALLKEKRYLNWGTLYLPHDGRHKDFKTGKSAEEIMQALGWTVKITPNMSIEDGIR
jgi:phage terminase large subunit